MPTRSRLMPAQETNIGSAVVVEMRRLLDGRRWKVLFSGHVPTSVEKWQSGGSEGGSVSG